MKHLADWIHLLLTTIALACLSTHLLEVLIVVILMYDIGFEYPAIDKLATLNNAFRRWLHSKITKLSKKKNKK